MVLPEADRENIEALLAIIQSDIELAIQKLNLAPENERPFYSRSYLRAYASWVEGMLHMHKSLIANNNQSWHAELPIECQLYLFEADWYIAASGKPKLTDKKIRTRQNIKAFFTVSSELFSDYEVDFGTHGWECVLSFYKLRDSLMHPEQASVLTLSVEEIGECDSGRKWLLEQFQLVRDQIKIKSRESA